MLLISANPATKRPKPVKYQGGKKMAKKKRSPAQRAATARMLAANKRLHRNPTRTRKASKRRSTVIHVNPKHRRRTVRRNPGFLGGTPNVLKELLSMEGALMIGAAMVAPMIADYGQEKLMPSATGYTKIAVKGAIIGVGAWLIAKFLKKPKVALAFGVTGAAVLASDVVAIAKGTLSGLSASEAELMASTPGNVKELVVAGYRRGLADSGQGYRMGLASNPRAFNRSFA